MIFLWGAVGYLVGGFAPGYLLIRAFRIERLLPPIAGPFAFSLIVNCVIVEGAVLFGAYTTTVARGVGSVVVLISALALLSDRRLTFEVIAERMSSVWLLLSKAAKSVRGRSLRILLLLCWVAALAVILQTLYLLASSFGSILVGYDPVVQWNPWAVGWAANRFPSRIYHYPQLIPILWSIPYVLMGNSEIEFFSSSFKFVFWLLTIETLIFISVRSRNPVLLLSISIASILFWRGVGETSAQDYIDVPVAFFSLLSVAAILQPAAQGRQQQEIALALVLASGAAMTKQVGLYLIGAIPLLSLCWIFEERKQFAPVFTAALSLAWKASLAVLLCAPIYIYAFITIRNGTNGSELGYLFEGVYENRSRVSRAIEAVRTAYAWLGFGSTPVVIAKIAITALALAFFSTANIAAFRDARYRWILLVINIPFTCLWAFFFSYDWRNLALAMPHWALTSAAGVSVLLERHWLSPVWSKTDCNAPQQRVFLAMDQGAAGRYGVASTIVIAAVAIVMAADLHFSESRLQARQGELELQMLTRGEPISIAPMLSLMTELGPSLNIFSEWRWACAFHFNRSSGRCIRIFPDEFFQAPPDFLIADRTNSLLLICLESSMNRERESWLAAAGFVERRTKDSGGARYFVRERRG